MIEDQVTASGATWLDRQLLAKDPPLSGGGFGAEVRDAWTRASIVSPQKGLLTGKGNE